MSDFVFESEQIVAAVCFKWFSSDYLPPAITVVIVLKRAVGRGASWWGCQNVQIKINRLLALRGR